MYIYMKLVTRYLYVIAIGCASRGPGGPGGPEGPEEPKEPFPPLSLLYSCRICTYPVTINCP